MIDSEQWEQTYEEQRTSLVAYATMFLRSGPAAEDVVQESIAGLLASPSLDVDGSQGTDGGPFDGLARIDLEDASVTRLQGAGSDPLACPSADTFLVVADAGKVDATPTSIDPTTGDRLPEFPDAPRTVSVVKDDQIFTALVDVPGPSNSGEVAERGCAEGGMVVWASDGEDRPLIVTATAGGDAVTERPPAAPLGGGAVHYQSDMTGTALVATVDEAGDGKSHDVAVWDASRQTWKRLDGFSSSLVDVAGDGTVFVAEWTDSSNVTTLRRAD